MMQLNPLRLVIYVLFAGAIFSVQPRLHREGVSWNRDIVPDLGRSSSGMYHLAGIEFFDDSRLIVYAVTHDTGQLSSRKSPEVSSSFRLHAWIVDADSGDEKGHSEWGTRAYDSEVRVTTGGVLIKTGGMVRLYSPDFAQFHDLPIAADPNGTYFTSVSASGNVIAISHYVQSTITVNTTKGTLQEQRYISHIDVLDVNSLKVRASWDQYPPLFHFSMSDDKFSTVHDGAVAISEFGGTGRTTVVADLGASKMACVAGGAGPFVVSEELMVLRDCKAVFLITTTSGSFPLDGFNGRGTTAKRTAACAPYIGQGKKAAIASKGARFIALTLPLLGIMKPLLAEQRTCLEGLHIAVYDLMLKKRVLTVNVDPLPKKDYDIALSPDGSKLAILNDRNVSVHSVPIQQTEKADGAVD